MFSGWKLGADSVEFVAPLHKPFAAQRLVDPCAVQPVVHEASQFVEAESEIPNITSAQRSGGSVRRQWESVGTPRHAAGVRGGLETGSPRVAASLLEEFGRPIVVVIEDDR